MNAERKQILEMLADGKITADEAAQLLDRLAEGRTEESEPAAARGAADVNGRTDPGADGAAAAHREGPSRKPKFLRVQVDSTDGDRVNIRVPLELVRTGVRLSAMLPENARTKLNDKGIDLSQISGLQGEELIEALRELTVDVDSADGDTVRVYCE
jgi:hypothetical protein